MMRLYKHYEKQAIMDMKGGNGHIIMENAAI